MNVISIARKATKAVVLPAGLFSQRRPGDVVILLYHRLGMGKREIDLPTESFDRQLALLLERDRVLSLDQALAGEGGVVLTFDDGYRDFYDEVLPRLAKNAVPALLYLATGLVAEGVRAKDALTWPQLEEAVATGFVTIGSHTHGHANLARATESTAEEEMRRSKELIEDRLSVACRHFSYPWGVASPAADRVARRLFASAALDGWRTNRRGRTDPYRLGRVPVLRSDGSLFFRAKIRGLLDGEALVYRLLRRGPWRHR